MLPASHLDFYLSFRVLVWGCISLVTLLMYVLSAVWYSLWFLLFFFFPFYFDATFRCGCPFPTINWKGRENRTVAWSSFLFTHHASLNCSTSNPTIPEDLNAVALLHNAIGDKSRGRCSSSMLRPPSQRPSCNSGATDHREDTQPAATRLLTAPL